MTEFLGPNGIITAEELWAAANEKGYRDSAKPKVEDPEVSKYASFLKRPSKCPKCTSETIKPIFHWKDDNHKTYPYKAPTQIYPERLQWVCQTCGYEAVGLTHCADHK